jgi:beta-galactosidase GanA
MKSLKSFLILTLLVILSAACSHKKNVELADWDKSIPHLVKQGTATQLIVNGSPFLMLGGELHNSSMGGFEYMRPIWKRMADANINTLISTASWELVEPQEGQFDFSLVDSMILGARKEGLKLVVIWFGSWKNSASSYVPSWVKLDQKRFPLIKDENGKTLNILSTLGRTCNADAKAFTELMKHIREIDSRHNTVVMMQIENEIGTLRTKRDYSDVANAAFNGPVPAELMDYFRKNKDSLHPGVLEAWGKPGLGIRDLGGSV